MTCPEPADAEAFEFLTFVAGGQSFGIEIRQIREIRRWSPVTALPHAPSEVLGVINLRGSVVPILDLSVRLGLGSTEPSARHVFIITRIGQRTLGLLVESVSEIGGGRRDQVRDVPAVGGFGAGDCVCGLIETGEDMIRLIDLLAVMPDADLAVPA